MALVSGSRGLLLPRELSRILVPFIRLRLKILGKLRKGKERKGKGLSLHRSNGK